MEKDDSAFALLSCKWFALYVVYADRLWVGVQRCNSLDPGLCLFGLHCDTVRKEGVFKRSRTVCRYMDTRPVFPRSSG